MDQERCDRAVQTLRRPVGLRGVFFCLNAQIHPRIFVQLSRRIDLLCVRFRVINTLHKVFSESIKRYRAIYTWNVCRLLLVVALLYNRRRYVDINY